MDTARKTVFLLLWLLLFPVPGHAWTEQTVTPAGKAIV